MPGPNGPSRSTVGGTTRQPVASDNQVGADLPAGQRAVGEVPQRPLAAHTACRRTPRQPLVRIAPIRVTLEAFEQPALEVELAVEQQGAGLGVAGRGAPVTVVEGQPLHLAGLLAVGLVVVLVVLRKSSSSPSR